MAVPAHRRAVSWRPASPEALRLAGALRTARLTLLRAGPGSDTTPLLTEGLLPLLHRRATDASVVAAPTNDAVLMPFPERRDMTRPRPAELVVLFEGCGPAPLARLRERIDAAMRAVDVGPGLGLLRLADWLVLLGSRYNTRLLFVFDRFEDVLMAPPPDRAARDQLLDQLVQSIDSKAPARFLLAVNGDAPTQARLDEFVRRLPAIVPELMWLPGDGAPADTARPGPPLRAVARPVAPPAAAPKLPAWRPSEPTPYHFSPLPPHDPAPPTTRPAATSPPARAAPNPRRGRRYVTAAAWAGMALLWLAVLVVLSPSPQHEPTTATTTARNPLASASAPRPVLPAADVPVLNLIVEGEAGRPTRLAGELARALQADGGAELQIQPTTDVLAGLAAPASGAATLPRLAIVRYDALRAAASATPASSLAVVAPLYTEELRIAVRADSPLEFIHQIKGRRINIGPRTSTRALTAATLYRRLFNNASIPSTTDGALDTRTALSRLADSSTLDAVLLVAPGSSTEVESVPAALRQRIKWLRLDPHHPASRRALQIYLPARLQSAAGAPIATLASVAFLVTTQPAPRTDAEALARFVQAMCRSLPALQRGGDAKWREVKAGLELPTGLPTAGATETAWRDCASLAEGLPGPNSKAPLSGNRRTEVEFEGVRPAR